jgi:hypothetical protein
MEMTTRIQLVHDEDYEPHGATAWGEPDDSDYERETLEKFANGMWDVYGIVVERQCGECGEWKVTDSLWGSVADAGHFGTYDAPAQIRDSYLRDTAADMLTEPS